MRIDRREFYNTIWTTPTSQLAKEFGVSDVWLGKLCKKHDVPRPPRGYWAKQQSGKPTSQIPLPPITDTKLETIEITPQPVPPKQVIPPMAAERIVAERSPKARIKVVETLEAIHPLVRRTWTSLKSTTQYHYAGLLQTGGEGCLDVKVGPDSIERAMRIMDALIKALEERDYQVVVKKDGSKTATFAEVDGQLIPFRIYEHFSEHREPAYHKSLNGRNPHWSRDQKYIPNGALELLIESSSFSRGPLSFKDGSGKRVEDQLNEFAVGLIEASVAMKENKARWEVSRRADEERRKQVETAERLQEEEAERIVWVDGTLNAWNRCRNLREMIQEARTRASELGLPISPGSHLGRWIEAAEHRLSTLDPLGLMLAELRQTRQADGRSS
ncbi:hypothetical protein [Paludisphaera borealis]|uniref:Uncharacterized protein n=1 Tax=Paludisphaera borealis TaxID=1387353 RepID=A0A1U7CYH0_9BACT|nr:hypothetical protein [Paludisphaera borealis]APW63997.1 hypothetical protein BSF38_05585 [Paludisphaera borealis]